MIKHDDWDATEADTTEEAYRLPEKVESVSFSHDGGRIYVSINGVEVYKTMRGTRDCTIEIDNT